MGTAAGPGGTQPAQGARDIWHRGGVLLDDKAEKTVSLTKDHDPRRATPGGAGAVARSRSSSRGTGGTPGRANRQSVAWFGAGGGRAGRELGRDLLWPVDHRPVVCRQRDRVRHLLGGEGSAGSCPDGDESQTGSDGDSQGLGNGHSDTSILANGSERNHGPKGEQASAVIQSPGVGYPPGEHGRGFGTSPFGGGPFDGAGPGPQDRPTEPPPSGPDGGS